MHELSRRSGVGRPTIYRWRDGAEVPQARPVGLVADLLGIPRERAVRLAGIIADTAEAERSPPSPLDELLGDEAGELMRKRLRAKRGKDAARLLRLIEEILSQPPADDAGPAEPGARQAPR